MKQFELNATRNKNGLFMMGNMKHIMSYTAHLKDSHTGATKLIDILPSSPMTFYDKASASEFYSPAVSKVNPKTNTKKQRVN